MENQANEPVVGQGPEVIDFTFGEDTLNGRELGQLIVGTLSGRSYAGELDFRVRVDDPRVAAVVAALVQAGWAVRQTVWGGADKSVTLRVWTD